MPSPFFFNEDVGATLSFVIEESDGTAYDLTGGTVELLVEDLDTFTCTIDSAVNGLASYVVQADEFPKGTYRAHVRVTIGSTVLHTNVFKINVGEALDPTSTPPVIPPPSGNPTEGAIPFGGTGGGTYTEDPTNLKWSDTANNLLLFGGTAGTNGAKLLALAIGTSPSTSPADTLQLWVKDVDDVASSAGLQLRDEQGGRLQLGTYGSGGGSGTMVFDLQNPAGTNLIAYLTGTTSVSFGTGDSVPLFLMVNSATVLGLTAAGNVGIGATAFGSNAAKVLGQFVGTAPTTAPADLVQHWVADRNGAGTAAPYIRTEDGGINERTDVITLQSYDGVERTCTNSATDLSTHTVNIPATDAFMVCGLFRKTAGAAASVSLGIKVNGTQIINNFAVSNVDNEAQMGSFAFGVDNTFGVGRDTNYTQGAIFTARSEAAGTALASFTGATYANQLPTAAITQIIITGITGSASTTLGIKHVSVYRISRS